MISNKNYIDDISKIGNRKDNTPGMRQSKTQQSAIADQKSLETVFSIDICRLSGEKWQSKTLFLTIFDLRSSIVFSVFDCRLSGVIHMHELRKHTIKYVNVSQKI